MADRAGGGGGSAPRRRERRLRSRLRRERQSIAMHLAEASHHSAGPSKVAVRRRDEEMEREKNEAPRRSRERQPEHVPMLFVPQMGEELVDESLPRFLLFEKELYSQRSIVQTKAPRHGSL